MAVRMLTQTVTYSDEPALSAEPELSDIRAVSGVGGGRYLAIASVCERGNLFEF